MAPFSIELVSSAVMLKLRGCSYFNPSLLFWPDAHPAEHSTEMDAISDFSTKSLYRTCSINDTGEMDHVHCFVLAPPTPLKLNAFPICLFAFGRGTAKALCFGPKRVLLWP